MAIVDPAHKPFGLLAAAVTPFRSDESIDEARLHEHYRYMLDAGVDGLMVVGGCGEYANLTPEERKRVVSLTCEMVAEGTPVVVGALGPSTREVLDLGLHAARAGATALLVLPPYYIKPSLDGVLDHFQTIAAETGLPVIAYNNPGRTGWPIGIAELGQIAELPGVVGLKETERDMASIALKIAAVGDRLDVISGDDDLGFLTLLSGGRGAIWASPNLHPRMSRALYDAGVRGDLANGLRLNLCVSTIMSRWMIPNHPSPLKAAMTMVGRSAGPGRRPLGQLSDAQCEALAAVLRDCAPIE
jgi:4-hydroxy-tetrahydrodipicolinate synthase